MTMHRTLGTGSAAGFTLIELLAVLTILVMAASMVPLALNRALPSRRIASTSDRLVAAVRSAQAASARSGQTLTLVLDEDAVVVKSLDSGTRTRLPTGTKVTLSDLGGNPAESLTVFPDGSAQAATFQIEAADHKRTVRLSALTGRLSIEDK
jgi:general secretion pathway protein H